MEKFNPSSPEYKKVADLPKEEQENFKDVNGGFVGKTVLENYDEIRADEEFLLKMSDSSQPFDAKIIKENEGELSNERRPFLGTFYDAESGKWFYIRDEKIISEFRGIVKELYEPLKNILSQLQIEIENNKFDLLITDDASARIPTLIVKKFIDAANEKNGHKKINICHIAGSKDLWNEDEKIKKISNYLKELQNRHNTVFKNALVITDMIDSGETMMVLCNALNQNNIRPTLGTIDSHYYMNWNRDEIGRKVDDPKKRIESFLNAKIIDGLGDHRGIYKNYHLHGVEKDPDKLHAKPISGKPTAGMIIARDEANKIAEKLIAELL